MFPFDINIHDLRQREGDSELQERISPAEQQHKSVLDQRGKRKHLDTFLRATGMAVAKEGNNMESLT